MAKGPDTSMAEVMQMMLKMQTENREADLRRERDRETERLRRDDQLRREAEQREERILLALKETQPVVPQIVTIVSQKLPDMKEGEEVEVIFGMFEAALKASNVPEDQWCAKLHAHLNPTTKLRIQDIIQNPDSTYQAIKDALLGCGTISFSAASEALMSADRNRILALPYRQAVDKMARLLEKVASEVANIKEIYQYIAIAHTRYYLNPEVKQYVDQKGDFTKENHCRMVEEWQSTQLPGTKWSKRLDNQTSLLEKHTNKTNPTRKIGSCFHCGKQGHYSKECRTRLAKEWNQQYQSSRTPVVKTETAEPSQTAKLKKEITCFDCRQKGHKSPQCPLRVNQVKKINIPANKVVPLRKNEVFGAIGNHRLPITCDTGAEVTVVPEECVNPNQFTGETCELAAFNKTTSEGKWCNVDITIDDVVFHRKAVTQPGELLAWTACLSLDLADHDEGNFILTQMRKRASLKEQETLYLPPEIKDGALLSGVLVSEGNLVEEGESPVVNIQPVPAIQMEVEQDVQLVQKDSISEIETEMQAEQIEVEGEREVSEQNLAVEQIPSGDVEVEGDSLGGGAEVEVMDNPSVEGMKTCIPRTDLAQAKKQDKSLSHIYKLGELDKEGYHMVDSILFRARLDIFGQTVEQICLPTSYRQRCLTLAHNNFGHQGRTKMVDHIKPYFYWPYMTRDCLRHVRACDICQRTDKTNPKHNCMQQREITTIPFESVAINLVGPFPTAVGGFRFLLTCIDNATRWPDAISIGTTTAKTIIAHLTNIFTRCGFPSTLTSDNGTQFTGKTFHDWLRHHGIRHVRSTPYHPQGNRVVERLHRTLNNMITKITESKVTGLL